MSGNDGEKIGYGNPPRSTQFQKGRSGNPKGRPKGTKNLATVVAQTANGLVAVTENGKRRKISRMEAAIIQLMNKAAAGDPKATQTFLPLIQAIERRSIQPAPTEAEERAEQQIIGNLIERIRNSVPSP
jgi:hypothetical protein